MSEMSVTEIEIVVESRGRAGRQLAGRGADPGRVRRVRRDRARARARTSTCIGRSTSSAAAARPTTAVRILL